MISLKTKPNLINNKSNTFKRILSILPAIIIALLFITPFKVSDDLPNRFVSGKEFWFLGVVAAILLYGGIHLLFTRQTLKINFNFPDILLLAFYAWCFVRACFTQYTPVIYNHKLQMLTGGIVIYFFIKWSIQSIKLPNPQIHKLSEEQIIEHSNNQAIKQSSIHSFKYFLLFAFLLSGLFQAVYGLLQQYGYYPSNHGSFKITGSFFNPAPYALYLSVVFPLALGTILYTFKEIKDITIKNTVFYCYKLLYYLAIITIISILLVLPLTKIRASWLGALTGSSLVLWYAIKHQMILLPLWFKKMFSSKTKSSIIIIFSIALIASSIIFLYKLKEGSSEGKSLIWEVTLGKIAEKPLFGHGLGRFEAEYNNWQARYFQTYPSEKDGTKGMVAGNNKYCFNDYLEITSEVGIIGLGIFIALIVVLFTSAVKRLKNEREDYLISCFASFLSFLIILAISFPFFNAPVLILFFIIIGIISAINEDWFYKPKIFQYTKSVSTASVYLMSLILIVASIGTAYNQYYKRIAYKSWKIAAYAYKNGDFTSSNLICQANFEQLKYEGRFLQHYGKSLQMAKQNKKAIEIIEEATKLTSDNVLYCTLGEAYKAEKEYTFAENAFLFSSSMIPHLLLPHYLLAKLYVESGEKEKAIAKANEILAKNPKIENKAVEEIKNEMRKIKNEYNKQKYHK